MGSHGAELEPKPASSESEADRPDVQDYLPPDSSAREPSPKLVLFIDEDLAGNPFLKLFKLRKNRTLIVETGSGVFRFTGLELITCLALFFEDGSNANHQSVRHDLLDISSALNEAVGAIVDDSFTRCFKSNAPEPWNWNIYLFPLWCFGVLVRYLILFPARVIVLAMGHIIFFSSFFSVHFLLQRQQVLRRKIQRFLAELLCCFYVASWTGVIKYHGPLPSLRPNQVFVANHTSMIDFIILEQVTPFAVIMQKHPGWVGVLQNFILETVGGICFNRAEAKDREVVGEKLKNHVQGSDNNPLLIFPEGTCVNNQYSVMFKKGAFELDCAVCPIAIKYNKIFVDAFWNSKKQSFTKHLVRLMTSWAVVCDVWYLEPQTRRPDETQIEFAERVRDKICARAGLKKVPWDGYLKHSRPGPKLKERKQQSYAESILQLLEK